MTKTEELIAGIWRESLGDVEIHADSNFFALGGDSLTMLTVLFRIGEIFAIDLPPGVFFLASSLKDLCERIETERREMSRSQPIESSSI